MAVGELANDPSAMNIQLPWSKKTSKQYRKHYRSPGIITSRTVPGYSRLISCAIVATVAAAVVGIVLMIKKMAA